MIPPKFQTIAAQQAYEELREQADFAFSEMVGSIPADTPTPEYLEAYWSAISNRIGFIGRAHDVAAELDQQERITAKTIENMESDGFDIEYDRFAKH